VDSIIPRCGRYVLMAQSGRAHVTAWCALAAWLLCTAGAFWYFELRDWRPFSSQSAQPFDLRRTGEVESWFRANVHADASGQPQLTFIHLYSPGCGCNGYTESHLRRLLDRYQSRGVRFLAAATPSIKGSLGVVSPSLGLSAVGSTQLLAAAGIATAPAALIFDAAGRLLYYGPYSNAAWCGSGGGLVEPVIDRALAGRPPIPGNSPAGNQPVIRGCFCAW
jgi:hypothetical protein